MTSRASRELRSCDVAIVGAGLSGAALAGGLRKRGYQVKLFEASEGVRPLAGNTISIGLNGIYSLQHLVPNAAQKIKDRQLALKKSVTAVKKTYSSEPVVMVNDFGGVGGVTLIRWQQVHGALLDELEYADDKGQTDDILCWGYRATGVTESVDHVTLHFQDKPDVQAKVVIAADGVRSSLRKYVVPQHPGPRYLGQMSWYSTIPNPYKDVEEGTMKIFEVGTRGGPDWMYSTLMPTDQGHICWTHTISSDEPAFTNTQGRDPSTMLGCWGPPGVKERLMDMLGKAGFQETLEYVKLTPAERIFERASHDLQPLDEVGGSLVSPKGRVLLMGDAAHGIYPGPGMGARLAFEDSHTIATLLDKYRDQLTTWTMTSPIGDDGHGIDRDASMERQAIQQLGAEYGRLRLHRMCSVQRYAAEMCGVAAIRDAYKPAGLTPEEMQKRSAELFTWVSSYPDNQDGDPNSTYWKPPASKNLAKTLVSTVV